MLELRGLKAFRSRGHLTRDQQFAVYCALQTMTERSTYDVRWDCSDEQPEQEQPDGIGCRLTHLTQLPI
jgi:hypothetical protein